MKNVYDFLDKINYKEAFKCSNVNEKHIAIAVLGGKIIEYGMNSERSTFKLNGKRYNEHSEHAEVNLVRKLNYLHLKLGKKKYRKL